MIEALESEGMTIAEIAELTGMTEPRLRSVYLQEPERLRLLGRSDRVVVELPRP